MVRIHLKKIKIVQMNNTTLIIIIIFLITAIGENVVRWIIVCQIDEFILSLTVALIIVIIGFAAAIHTKIQETENERKY